MQLTRYIFTLILILGTLQFLPAQTFSAKNKNDQKIFNEAENWFVENYFEKALQLYEQIYANYTADPFLNYRIGLCYLNIPNQGAIALEFMQRANTGALDNTDFHFYFGKALHMQEKFDEAIVQFNKFLLVKKITKDSKIITQELIQQCETGKKLIENPVPVNISNIKRPVNTEYSEYVPLISSDESVLLYTYRGNLSNGGVHIDPLMPDKKIYLEDIFMTLKDSTGNWITPLHLDANINTEGNDACVALTADAQRMFMFRSIGKDPGSIYESELDGLMWSDPELVAGDLNSAAWDGSITISADGKRACFSSERKGGKGQRDLYQARLKNGKWTDVKNLGDHINSSANEDAPFLHPSGRYLIFSSDGKNTMGGYDIFVCELQSDSTWGKPENIGYPINTTGNEKFYTISADGRHGYFASSKSGGEGEFDIYMVTPGLADRPILLAQVKGRITIDGKPVMARIDVQDVKTGIVLYSVTSNSYTGKYLVDLPAGIEYKLTYDVGGYPPDILVENTIGLTSFKEIIHNVNFGDIPVDTSTFANEPDTLPNTTANRIEPNEFKTVPKEKLLDIAHPDLIYRVQIGAYRFPQNFKYNQVMSLGKKDEKEKLDDDITRFTLGRFETLREAYAFRDKVKQQGIGDTFVTAIYKGKRYLLTDLGPALYEALKYEQAYQPFFIRNEGDVVLDK